MFQCSLITSLLYERGNKNTFTTTDTHIHNHTHNNTHTKPM